MRKTLLPILAAAIVLAACGKGDEPTVATTTPVTTAPPVGDDAVALRVEVGTGEVVGALVATIAVEGGAGSVTGYLTDPAPVIAALADSEATGLLVNGADEQQACTEQYGGPDVAHIRGTIGDTAIDLTVDRADGCGIANWDLLQPLLPPPLWTDDPGATATYGDPAHPVRRAVGERFTVRLAANATTGFEWQIELPTFVTLVGDEYEAPDEQVSVGAGGTQVFELELAGAGDGIVELAYRQPFDEAAPPSELRSISVVASG